MASKAKNELGQYLENIGNRKKMNKKTSRMEKRNVPAGIKERNTRGYIVENGLDRQDAKQYREDYDEFSNKVMNMVENNEGRMLQRGKRYINYSLVRPNKKK